MNDDHLRTVIFSVLRDRLADGKMVRTRNSLQERQAVCIPSLQRNFYSFLLCQSLPLVAYGPASFHWGAL
jgi:hypothetical protein